MPEIAKVNFSHKEVVSALLKLQGIHKGIWGLYVEFGIGAGNVGPSTDEMQPAAIIPVLKIGLQKFDAITNISVDAAEVNPIPHGSDTVQKTKTVPK